MAIATLLSGDCWAYSDVLCSQLFSFQYMILLQFSTLGTYSKAYYLSLLQVPRQAPYLIFIKNISNLTNWKQSCRYIHETSIILITTYLPYRQECSDENIMSKILYRYLWNLTLVLSIDDVLKTCLFFLKFLKWLLRLFEKSSVA